MNKAFKAITPLQMHIFYANTDADSISSYS